MKESLSLLVFTMIVCQIAVQLTPERDSAKKGVKLICGLAVLLTLLTPLRAILEGAGELRQAAETYFDERTSERTEESEEAYARAAREILTYASDATGTDSAELTLVTGENGEVREIQLFVELCSYSSRAEVEAVLEEAYGIPVFIFVTESGTDDGKTTE